MAFRIQPDFHRAANTPVSGRAASAAPAAAVEVKPTENLLKVQPKLVKYPYSEKALAQIEKIQDEVSPAVTVIAKVENKPRPEAVNVKPVAVDIPPPMMARWPR